VEQAAVLKRSSSRYPALAGLVALGVGIGGFIVAAPMYLLLPVVFLVLAIPLFGLSLSHPRLSVIVLMLAAPLTGILKAITGSRYAPLAVDAAVVLVCAAQFLHAANRGKLRLGVPDLLHGALLVLALIEILNPNVPSLQAGVEGFRKFAFASIAFYIGRHVITARDWLLLMRASSVVAPLISAYAIKQYFFLSAVDWRMIDMATASRVTYLMGGAVRPFATMPGPFHLGLYVAIMIIAWFGLGVHVRRKQTRRLWFPFTVVLPGIALFLTRTKGNWVAVIAGLAVLLALRPGSVLLKMWRILALTLALISVFAYLLSSSSALSSTLDDALYAVTHPLSAPTFLYRLDLWLSDVLPAIARSPLLGYGTSSATEGLSNLYAGTGSSFFSSHSLYLKILLEMGVPGLVLFMLLVARSVFVGARYLVAHRSDRGCEASVIRTCAATAVLFLVAGLVIPVLDAYPCNYLFWLALGTLSMAPVRRPL
jgi:O-antigen ligase